MSTTSAPRALTRYTPRFAPGQMPAKLAAVAVAAGAATVALPTAHAEAATTAPTARTFYVSPSGSDANSGTDTAHPFKSLGKVSNGFLQPGDTVLLQGGATFTDKLGMWSSGTASAPITVSSYHGTATLTQGCLDVGGDYLTATNILVTGCSDDSGIFVYGNHDTVTNVEVTDNIQGIVIDMHAQNASIVHNNVHDNDRMAPNRPGPYDDYGAVGISVGGINTEVAYNDIRHNVATSPDFGEDGSAVEIYGGINSTVHHNLSIDNSTFTELGNARTANTSFTNNRVFSSLDYSQFLVTRGASDYFGPVAGTTASHNTVQLTGSRSLGYNCYAGCTAAMFDLSDNVLDVAGEIGYLEGSMSGGNNVYYRGSTWGMATLPGDKMADPNLTPAFFSATDMGVTAGVDPTATYVSVDTTTSNIPPVVQPVVQTFKTTAATAGGDLSASGRSTRGEQAEHGKHRKHGKHRRWGDRRDGREGGTKAGRRHGPSVRHG